jgi:hypothetical protein
MARRTMYDSNSHDADSGIIAGTRCDHWLREIARAEKHREEWLRRSEKLIRLYRRQKSTSDSVRRFAMLWANTEVLKPSVYARPPVPQVSRRFKDRDPAGRLAAEILERNCAFELERMNIDQALRNCRDDLLLPGRGTAWVRYEADADPSGVKAERVQVDYVHWKCFLHSPARTWEEVTWVAREGYFTKEELDQRFDTGKRGLKVELDHKAKSDSGSPETDPQKDAEAKATVYEIWSKRDRKVCFIAKGCTEALEESEPFLDLTEFWPCPRPLFATLTTDSLIPVPDYAYYQDQAEEIDDLTARIGKLTQALKLVGFYAAGDRNAAAIEKALEPGVENRVIPVESWAVFQEKGGSGGLAWLPVKDVAIVLKECVALRNQLIEDVYQITGLSDIQRGATDPEETAAAQQLKSQFGGLRVRDRQKEMARFARDLVRMTAEIMAERFDAMRLIETANLMPEDPAKLQETVAAVELLRNERLRSFRIDIETDSTIEPDENAEKQRRTEFVTAVGTLFQQAVPVVQQVPEMAPLIGEMLNFTVRGFRAGRMLEDQIERTMQAVQQRVAQMMQSGPPTDPKIALEAKRLEEIEKPKAAKEIEKMDVEIQNARLEPMKVEAEIAGKQFDQGIRSQEMGFKDRELGMQDRQMQQDGEFRQQELGMKENEANFNQAARRSEMVKSGMQAPPQPAQPVELPPDPLVIIQQGFGGIMQALQAIAVQQAQLMEFVAAPVEVIRGSDGRVVSAQKILPQRVLGPEPRMN